MAAPQRAVKPITAFADLFRDVRGRLAGASFGPLNELRSQNLARFESLGIPTPRAELWKYTNVTRLANVAMGLAPQAAVGANAVIDHAAGGFAARRLIFVNGHVAPELSHIEGLPRGVRVTNLAKALEADPENVTTTLAAADDGRSFTALNTAFAHSGAWIELDDGVRLAEPLQLLFLTVGQPTAVMTQPRIVVRLGRDALLRLVETHGSAGEGHCLTNLVSQVELADGATLEHDRTALPGEGQSLLSKAAIRLGARARLQQTAAGLGGALVRNESDVRIEGSGAECVLNGLYMPRGREHADTLIRIHHLAPDSHSDQFYKGVVSDASRAVFAGKIIVHKDAQKTNAFQKNDNLLLSDDAEIDTKPELEIYADDVKCSHGATIGDLDPTALFYLRSRGLGRDAAASILTYAFAADVIGRFADETVRAHLREAALRRLPGGAALGDLL